MSDSRRFGIEAFFLGLLAVVVFGGVLFAAVTTQFGKGGGASAGTTNNLGSAGTSTISVSGGNSDIVCQCFDAGFTLAKSVKNPESSAYRTGFTRCRDLGGYDGGAAWTAGWEARKSGRPYEASCKAYKRRR